MEEKKTSGRYSWGNDKVDRMARERILEVILSGLSDIDELLMFIDMYDESVANPLHELKTKVYDELYPPVDETKDIYLP